MIEQQHENIGEQTQANGRSVVKQHLSKIVAAIALITGCADAPKPQQVIEVQRPLGAEATLLAIIEGGVTMAEQRLSEILDDPAMTVEEKLETLDMWIRTLEIYQTQLESLPQNNKRASYESRVQALLKSMQFGRDVLRPKLFPNQRKPAPLKGGMVA